MKPYQNNDDEDELPDKNQVYREHMERIKLQKAKEEEALKFARMIRGVDKKKYKELKFDRTANDELSDKQKLELTRVYQFLIALMGVIGVIVIFVNLEKNKLFSEKLTSEIDFILIGCVLAAIGVVGVIALQHRHDKISDRIFLGEQIRKRH